MTRPRFVYFIFYLNIAHHILFKKKDTSNLKKTYIERYFIKTFFYKYIKVTSFHAQLLNFLKIFCWQAISCPREYYVPFLLPWLHSFLSTLLGRKVISRNEMLLGLSHYY